MLELKRKAHQYVLIGEHARLTVLALENATTVRVRLSVPAVNIDLPLSIGRSYEADVEGYRLRVDVAEIERGEVTLRFEANRELRIDRGEVRAS